MDFGMECHGKFAPSHINNNLHARVARTSIPRITSGPPSSCNQSFLVHGKGIIPKCTVYHQSPYGTRANSPCQPGGLCRAGVVGLALRQLERYIRAPVSAVKASRPPH